ncbi:MAG: peptide ABC transporter substrate-binding protein [Ruminococcus sp.]|uniref:ABC transporter substrate-binding protein n=1 Tax=Ruminococcus sp. TaxID=41978 RepID=UPI0025DF3C8D|nr:ABC transporter substrate-binding protein [Ruminococcus sp.]MBR5684382.1 peptide ABC transporter substrate-binding protein [Ruminococcus sp.]
MKNKRKAVMLAAVLLMSSLAGCGGNDDKRGSGAGHMYSAALEYNPKSLDPQFANDPSSATVIKNMYSGLVMKDGSGNIVCCNASDYSVSDDGREYTFHLRDDNYWFFDKNENDKIDEDEYFPVVAADYVFALRRILDPNMHSPYAKDFMCIRNSRYVVDGSGTVNGLGAWAEDDRTLVIDLDKPCAEFLALMTTPAAFPCNEEFFQSTKGRYGLDDRSVMSNGPFFVRQWFFDPYGSNNILYMRKNEVNENDNYSVLPTFVSFSIEDGEEEVRQRFKAKEAECFTTMKVGGYNPRKYSIIGQKAITLGLVFNPEDKIYSNPNIRKAIALAADRNAIRDENSGDISPAYGIIPPATDLFGRSYRELVSDKQFDVFDTRAAAELLAKAKAELNINSVESVKIIVDSNTIDSRYLHQLSQSWQDSLGIYIGIEDLTSAEFSRRLADGEYSIALYPLKADFNSGIAVMNEFDTVECLKNAVNGMSCAEKILQCPSAEELVNRYSQQEKDILDQFGFIPLFYKSSYLVADEDNEDIIYDAFTGSVDYRVAKNYS